MNSAFVFINVFTFFCLIFAFIKDRAKTKRALVISLKSFFRILPMVVATVILIGLILGFVPRDQISRIIGEQAGFRGIFVVAVLGAVLHIPSIISYNFVSSCWVTFKKRGICYSCCCVHNHTDYDWNCNATS
jgi:uncharacterized membrane protein YraQ (UPF0718 family)